MLTAVATSVLASMLPDDPAARRRASSIPCRGCGRPFPGCRRSRRRRSLNCFAALLSAQPAIRRRAGFPSWNSASEAEVTAFSRGLAAEPFHVVPGAYAALHDLVFGAWYARPEHWEAIDYPGRRVF